MGDGAHAARVAAEVGREALDEEVGPRAFQGAHGGREVACALVREVVAVDAREHYVVHAPAGHRTRRALRLAGVNWRRRAVRLHGAEAAAARTRVAHQLHSEREHMHS